MAYREKGYSVYQRVGRIAVATGVGAAAYGAGVVVAGGCEILTAPETFRQFVIADHR
jgi:hypothetical protein